MNVETSLVMPGGWHFIDGQVRLESTDYMSLLGVVQRYRIENGLPVGDVKREVDVYICHTYPNQCHALNALPAVASHQPTAADMVLAAMTSLRKRATKLLFQTDAEVRAQICIGCPLNKPFSFGCASCSDNVERLGAFIRRGKDVASHKRLHYCSAFKEDNRSTVWVDADCLTKSTEVPEHCWRKA